MYLQPIVTQNAALICLVADWDGDTAPTVVDLAKRLERDQANTRKTVNLLKSEGLLTYTAAEGVGVTDTARAQVPALRVVTGEREVDPNALQLTASRLMPHPLNPRTAFAPEEIEALAEAIAEGGLLQNLTVRAMDPPGLATSHWIVAGERRWRAIRLLIDRKDPRWPADRKIRCQLVDIDDQQHLILATIENIARVDLNKIEEAKNFAALEATGLRPSQIAKKIGKTSRHVQRRLQLLTCEQHIQDQVAAGDMSVEAALATVQEKKPEVAGADEADPCVFDGRTYPNATLATEARRLAEGGGPSGSGSRPARQPHPDEATDNSISPAQALLLGEVLHKSHHWPHAVQGYQGETWARIAVDAPKDLRDQLRPLLWGGYLSNTTDGRGRELLRVNEAGRDYLKTQHDKHPATFDALAKLRFRIGARPAQGCKYVTAWLNCDEDAPTVVEAAEAQELDSASPTKPLDRAEYFSAEVKKAAIEDAQKMHGGVHLYAARLAGKTTTEGETWPAEVTERLVTPWNGHPSAKINLQVSDKGRWFVATSTQGKTAGQSSPPYVYTSDPIFRSRNDALAHATDRILDALGEEGQKRKLLDWLRSLPQADQVAPISGNFDSVEALRAAAATLPATAIDLGEYDQFDESYNAQVAAAHAPGHDEIMARDGRQVQIQAWVCRTFHANQTPEEAENPLTRARRFLEEAIELAQAVGLSRDIVAGLADRVYARPAGDVAQEIGGVLITLASLGRVTGVSLARAEGDEFARVLSISRTEFAARDQAKIAAGF